MLMALPQRPASPEACSVHIFPPSIEGGPYRATAHEFPDIVVTATSHHEAYTSLMARLRHLLDDLRLTRPDLLEHVYQGRLTLELAYDLAHAHEKERGYGASRTP